MILGGKRVGHVAQSPGYAVEDNPSCCRVLVPLSPQGSEGCRGLASGASLVSLGRPIHKGGSRVNRGLI
jgi:hypothetical protein